MKCCDMDSRSYFLLGARIFFGLWLLYAGIAKIIFFGPSNFVAYIIAEFAKTWSPGLLNMILAWLILVGEVVLGILLLLGKKMRCVWALTACLMFGLMFGQTLLQKFDMVADIWMYTIFCLACAALSTNSVNSCSSKT